MLLNSVQTYHPGQNSAFGLEFQEKGRVRRKQLYEEDS